MSLYDPDVIDAATDIAEAGGAGVLHVTTTPPTFDATTNTFTPGTPGTVPFVALQLKNNLFQLAQLGLVVNKTITLLMAAQGLTVTPTKGMALTWAGVTYTIADAPALNLDGATPVLYTVVASV